MDRNQIVRLALDARHNKVQGNFSMDETMHTLYQALVDANGGKNYLDIRDIRDGKCGETFAIIEQIIDEVKHDTLTTSPFFTKYVDYRNIERGDKNEFYIPDSTPLTVSEIGAGSQALRRQRLFGGETFTVKTSLKGLKVYEELDLLLANRVDFNTFMERIAQAFTARAIEDIYKVWTGSMDGLEAPYAYTGSYTEAQMLELAQHVMAANGVENAYIIGTMLALSKVTASHDTATVALESDYNTGIIGKFHGMDKVKAANMYKAGTTEFLLSDNEVNVMPANVNVKPIMYVTEGRSLILPHNPAENNDLTQEYMLCERTGVAARVPNGEGKFGRYTISA